MTMLAGFAGWATLTRTGSRCAVVDFFPFYEERDATKALVGRLQRLPDLGKGFDAG